MPSMQGYRLRSDAMNRLSNTMLRIPEVMSQNKLREKQFDLTSAMTRREMESRDLQDKLTGMKIEVQDMALTDAKEERERLNQPVRFDLSLGDVDTAEHLLYPLGEQDGKPVAVMDQLLRSVGATPEVDVESGALYGKLPDGSLVTQKHLQQHAPQFKAAMLAYTDPQKTILGQLRNIDREAAKAGGLTPEMAANKKQLMAQAEDPYYLLDADLKNLAVASAVAAPGTDLGIEQIQKRIEGHKQQILNRAEAEGKRAEAQSLIGLREAQAAYYKAQTEGEILKNKVAQQGGKAGKEAYMEIVKSLNKQIEEVNKMLVKFDPTAAEGMPGLDGGMATISPGQAQEVRARLEELYAERNEYLALATGQGSQEAKPDADAGQAAKPRQFVNRNTGEVIEVAPDGSRRVLTPARTPEAKPEAEEAPKPKPQPAPPKVIEQEAGSQAVFPEGSIVGALERGALGKFRGGFQKSFQGQKPPDIPADTLIDTKKYGSREDGTPKGPGWLGELKTPRGDVATEISVGVNIDGKETEIPLLVPTLSEKEIQHLLGGGKPTEEIMSKAVTHARKRIAAGQSPFKE